MDTALQPTGPTWDDVREPLRCAIGETPFRLWFTQVMGQVDGAEPGSGAGLVLRILAPSAFHCTWLRDNYAGALEGIWRALAPGGRVAFAIAPAVSVAADSDAEAVSGAQLDFWEDGKRAAPNVMVRSALFPALSHQTRKFLKEKTLCAVQGVKVVFTGEQFDQSDLDVYLEILNYARPFPLGTPVRFAAHGLLKSLGRPTGNSQHKWLHSVLVRLCGGVVDMTDHSKRYFGQLLFGGIRDEVTKHYEVTINPRFAVLFGFGMWTTIDQAQRQALGRNATAKALHAYYSSHTAPTAHHFDTLADIAGLCDQRARQRRARIIKAHDLMQSDDVGFLAGYEVEDNAILAHINHTPGQNRHLVQRLVQGKKRRTKKGK